MTLSHLYLTNVSHDLICIATRLGDKPKLVILNRAGIIIIIVIYIIIIITNLLIIKYAADA